MPLDTVLCLDTSDWMAGTGKEELRTACKEFLVGILQTAQQFDLKENIAVVEFGRRVSIVQQLTNDYVEVAKAIDSLDVGGPAPMSNGLLEAMKEIIERGGVLNLRGGRKLTPRIILMTNGKPSNKDEVIKVAMTYGPLWKTVGLPHPIPIACVGCGNDVDKELLSVVAKFTNGMFVLADDISQLTHFFRKQVLLIQFVAKFSDDLQQLRNLLLLRQFMQQMGESVEDDELQGLSTLLLAMLVLSDDDDDDSKDQELPGYPMLGARVRRGRDWKWGNQDGNGPGTVVKHSQGGTVEVEWDNGGTNTYRHGAGNARDLRVVDEHRQLSSSDSIKVGARVIRGPSWEWGNQDGGTGNIGAVYRLAPNADCNVLVRWPNGKRANYRYGDEHKDLKLLDQEVDEEVDLGGLLGGLLALAMLRELANAIDDDSDAEVQSIASSTEEASTTARPGGLLALPAPPLEHADHQPSDNNTVNTINIVPLVNKKHSSCCTVL